LGDSIRASGYITVSLFCSKLGFVSVGVKPIFTPLAEKLVGGGDMNIDRLLGQQRFSKYSHQKATALQNV